MAVQSEGLARLLDHLAAGTDEARCRQSSERFVRALGWEPVDRLPVVCRYPVPPEGPFPALPHRRIFADPEAMLYNELVCAFDTRPVQGDEVGDDVPWTVRANLGTVLIASVFGAPVEQIADNPPWVRGDAGRPSLEAVIEQRGEDIDRGWIPRAIEIYEAYRSLLAEYPPLAERVRLVLPDLQGPLDNLDQIVGSEVFAALIIDPDRVREALAAVAEAQVRVARRLQPLLSDGPDGFSHQHNVMVAGRVLIRADSAVMVAPGMYRDQVSPHDAHVLQALGGGGLHSCGRVDPHVPALLDTPGCRCLDFGQAELNDIDRAYAQARPRRQALLRVVASEEDLCTGRILERFPTGVVLRYDAP